MESWERQEKLKRESDLMYAAIGKFAVEFEHVCRMLAQGIQMILAANGLTNPKMAHAASAGLTADPLRKMYVALMVEHMGGPFAGKEKEIFSGVINRVATLAEKRNETLHGTWYVGWASSNQTDFSSVTGSKAKNTNAGLEFGHVEKNRV